MPNLKCHDTTCEHNHASCCGVKEVTISHNAGCLSYEPRMRADRTFDQEFAADLGRSFCLDNHPICCHDTICQNNSDCRCKLNNLRIDRQNGVPLCVNYRPRRD